MTYSPEEAQIMLNQEYAKKEQEIHEASYKNVEEDEDELAFLDGKGENGL